MMRFQRLLVVLIISLTICLCTGHIGGGQISLNADPQIYCGRTLARALALLCYEEAVGKRSEPDNMYESILLPYYKSQESPYNWPLLPAHHARGGGFQSKGKRYGPGVVNECCDKACSINELITYC